MAENTSNDTTFLFYNPTGFGAEKVSWVKDLVTTTNCSFVNLQVTFLTQHSSGRKTTGSATRVFSECISDYKHFFVPAVRQPGLTRGRASGGLAQLSTRCLQVWLY